MRNTRSKLSVLFFLVHPADFHQVKNVIKQLKMRGHKVTILIKTKDVLEQLVMSENWAYINTLRQNRTSRQRYAVVASAAIGLLVKQYELSKVVRQDPPDLMIGTEWALVFIGKLFGIPTIICNEDDTAATPENRFFYPFANSLLLPACCDVGKWPGKRITYDGYHELAYLHPNYFVPDEEIVKRVNLSDSPFAILRFVRLAASHDIGKHGISNRIAKEVISILERRYRIYINSERNLPDDFEKYRLRINPVDLHHFLYFADLVVADSQTVTAECAVLGTPSVRFNDFVGKLGYLEELEHRYKLTFGIKTSAPEKLYQKVEELLDTPNLTKIWQNRRQKMLSEKIDVSAFMVWLIENYPESVRIMKEDPYYQYRFK